MTEIQKTRTSTPQLSNVVKYMALVVLSIGGGTIYIVPYLFWTFGPQLETAMNVSTSTFALLMTVYGLACTILYIPAGVLADKFKAKTLFVFSLISTGLLTLAYMVFVTSFALVAIIHVGFAVTTVLTFWNAFIKAVGTLGPVEEHGQLYGISEGVKGGSSFIGSFLATMIVGVLAGTVNNFWDLRAMLLFLAILYVAIGILAWILLPKEGSTYYPKAAKAKRVVGATHESKYLYKTSSSEANGKNITKLFKMPIIWLISFIVLFIMMGYDIAGRSSYYFLAISGFDPSSAEYSNLESTLSMVSSIRLYLVALIFAVTVGFMSSKVIKNNSLTIIITSLVSIVFVAPLFVASGATGVSTGTLWTLIVFSLLFMFGVAGARAIYWALIGEGKIPAELVGLAVGVISIIGFSKDIWFSFIIGPVIDNELWGVYWGMMMVCLAAAAAVSLLAMIYMKKQTNIIKQETVSSEAKALFSFTNSKIGLDGSQFAADIEMANVDSNELFKLKSRLQKINVLLEVEKKELKLNALNEEKTTVTAKISELQAKLKQEEDKVSAEITKVITEKDTGNKIDMGAIKSILHNIFNIDDITTNFSEREEVNFEKVVGALNRIEDITYERDDAKEVKDTAKLDALDKELDTIIAEWTN